MTLSPTRLRLLILLPFPVDPALLGSQDCPCPAISSCRGCRRLEIRRTCNLHPRHHPQERVDCETQDEGPGMGRERRILTPSVKTGSEAHRLSTVYAVACGNTSVYVKARVGSRGAGLVSWLAYTWRYATARVVPTSVHCDRDMVPPKKLSARLSGYHEKTLEHAINAEDKSTSTKSPRICNTAGGTGRQQTQPPRPACHPNPKSQSHSRAQSSRMRG